MLMIANDTTEAPTGTSSLDLAARRARLPGQARVTPGTLGAETPAEVVTEAEQMPRRARYLVPRGLPRRDEVLAVCVVAVVLVHLLFAQLTIVIATVLYLITRVTRWRLSWLTVPAAAALAWTAAVGPRAAAAGFTAGPAQIVDYLTASGHQADHLLHFTDAFSGLGNWLPRQLPLALLAGTAEAALAGWLTWLHTDESDLPPARPGLIVAARRAATVRAIRSGGVVTRDGGSRRVRRPDHGVLGRGSRRRLGVRFFRAGRADHRFPAGLRRGPPAQTGARCRPHGRSRADRQAGRGLRGRRRTAAGVRRGRRGRRRDPGGLLRAVPAWRPGAARRADHRHAQLGRAGSSVPAQLRLLPRGRLRDARRRARRRTRSRARRRHPSAQPGGHASPAGVRARGLPPPGCAGRAGPGIDEPGHRRARHHRRDGPAAAGPPGVPVRPLAAPVPGRPGGGHRPQPRRGRTRCRAVPARRTAPGRELRHAHPPGLPGPAGRGLGAERDRRRR